MSQLAVAEALNFAADSTARLEEMAAMVKELVSRIKEEVPKEQGFRLEEGERKMPTHVENHSAGGCLFHFVYLSPLSLALRLFCQKA